MDSQIKKMPDMGGMMGMGRGAPAGAPPADGRAARDGWRWTRGMDINAMLERMPLAK